MSWLLFTWVVVNFALFAVLLGYSVELYRRWRATSIGFIAMALLLVAGTFLLTSIQRFGIHAARTGITPAEWEEFFLTGYQAALSVAGTVAGVYAITRLRAGIRRLEAGERMIGALTRSIPVDADASEWRLTDRESQVLATIVSGRTSDEQIAEALFISTATAATHVRNILRKSGLSSRFDLMLVAGRAGQDPTASEPGGI